MRGASPNPVSNEQVMGAKAPDIDEGSFVDIPAKSP